MHFPPRSSYDRLFTYLSVFGLTLALCKASAQAQGPRNAQATPVVFPPESPIVGRAMRAGTPPTLDGRDDDAIWRVAPAMTDFRQFDPGENVPTTFRTEARVAYDDRNLYVIVRAFDPHPDSIASLLSRRDVKTVSDQIKIIVDAYKDRRTGVEMAVNPAGVKRDAEILALGMDPDEVGEKALRGVLRNDLHIFTHPEFKEELAQLSEVILNASPQEAPDPRRLRFEQARRAARGR